jgi:hypothetical protein
VTAPNPTPDPSAPAEAAPPVLKKTRRGSESRKKSIPVTSRYDEAEFAELEEAASRAGLSRASYQRVQSLTKTKTRSTRRPPIERELAAQLLGQVGRVGGNLHQLVRHLNFGRELEEQRLAEVLAALEELKGEIMQALGRSTGHKPA